MRTVNSLRHFCQLQMSQLRYDASHPHDLDNILLIVALTGVISYNVFTIIGTQFSDHPNRILVLLNALTAVVQAIIQTVFVLSSSKRHLYTRRQEREKPGREVVTFLMVTNFAMVRFCSNLKIMFKIYNILYIKFTVGHYHFGKESS